MVEQLAFAEVAPRVEYCEIEAIVVHMLKGYKRLEAKIKMLELRATGQTFTTSRTIRKQINQLAAVGIKYVKDNKECIHQQRAENLFCSIQGESESDEQFLDQIREVFIGLKPFGGEAFVDDTGRVVPTIEEVMERKQQNIVEQLSKLDHEKETIDHALEVLSSYAPLLEKLLRGRYIEGKSVIQSARELNISERTHDHWKREAIVEFANLIGLL